MENGQDAQQKSPPYVSYSTFANALDSIAEHGAPHKIDRSVLKAFSGFNQTLLLSAFRYLGLTTDVDEPTPKLHEYCQADAEKRKGILGVLIKERYPQQTKILTSGSYQQLKDSFDMFGVQKGVKKKCISFFLVAVKATGYTISPYILKGLRTRGPRKEGAKKAPNKKPKERIQNDENTNDERSKPPDTPEGLVKVPIALGVGKTWYILLDEKHSQEDVKRFLQISQITLVE